MFIIYLLDHCSFALFIVYFIDTVTVHMCAPVCGDPCGCTYTWVMSTVPLMSLQASPDVQDSSGFLTGFLYLAQGEVGPLFPSLGTTLLLPHDVHSRLERKSDLFARRQLRDTWHHLTLRAGLRHIIGETHWSTVQATLAGWLSSSTSYSQSGSIKGGVPPIMAPILNSIPLCF